MMDYTTFKKVAENEIRGYLPEAYQNAMIDVAPVNKVNKTKDAMMVRLHEDTEVAPTMYLDDAYERYKETDDLNGVLKELAYYHDTGSFWDGYEVAGFHLTDIIVWQVEHFKAYMDRREEMNRYHTERLFLDSISVMLDMETEPQPYINKMRDESGTDFDQRVV